MPPTKPILSLCNITNQVVVFSWTSNWRNPNLWKLLNLNHKYETIIVGLHNLLRTILTLPWVSQWTARSHTSCFAWSRHICPNGNRVREITVHVYGPTCAVQYRYGDCDKPSEFPNGWAAEAKHLVQGIVSCLLSYTGSTTAGWSNAALTLRSAQHVYKYLGFRSLNTGM